MKIEFEHDQEQKHFPNQLDHQVVVLLVVMVVAVAKNHHDRVRSTQPETPIHIP